jgi:hypothetical protein
LRPPLPNATACDRAPRPAHALPTHPPNRPPSYWQLNDVWAGASWSSVDYGGRWKPAHHGVARLFAPLAVAAAEDGSGALEVFVINDHPHDLTLDLTIEVHSLEAPAPSDSDGRRGPGPTACSRRAAAAGEGRVTTTARVPASSAARVFVQEVDSLLAAVPGCSRATCFVRAAAAAAPAPSLLPESSSGGSGSSSSGGGGSSSPSAGPRRSSSGRRSSAAAPAVAEAVVWLGPFKDLPLQDPKIEFSAFELVDGHSGELHTPAVKFTVTSAAAAALAVWEAPGLDGRFSVNAVTLLPCRPLEVVFYYSGSSSSGGAAADELARRLRAASVWDHQRF